MGSSNPSLLAEGPVLVVGAGPIGLLTAYQLAKRGVQTILVERNHDTTRWPKMDITNARSMELLNHIGLADELKKLGLLAPSNDTINQWNISNTIPPGVDEKFSLNCVFSTGLSEGGEAIAKWDLPSPLEMRQRIHERNDGSMPSQAWLRCSQILFEAWLKPLVEAHPLVKSFSGMKFERLTEHADHVESTITHVDTGVEHLVRSQYVIGCDGAGSRVRKSVGINLTGAPIGNRNLLVHFKSSDLGILHRQGQFWHLFLSTGACVINQDEKDTWTIHMPLAPDADLETLNAEEMVFAALGDAGQPQRFTIDKILVTSAWNANLSVADTYSTKSRRVLLAGDSAHQNIPFGGYGMNTGVGDAYDLGWKLAMVLQGQCGERLLESYEIERRPVAIRNVAMSGTNVEMHMKYVSWVRGEPAGTVRSETPAGKDLRERIRSHVLAHDGENKYLGIEMGYRHTTSPVIVPDGDPKEQPPWTARDYFPSTWPGARAPHVYLNDGVTSIFERFGFDFTVVDFTEEGRVGEEFSAVAARLEIPLSVLHLPQEKHARQVWERDVVLIRPDHHVSWRSNVSQPPSREEIENALLISSGRR
ncbi:hypothetical protein ANOM_007572 [Aspergillus nomiae NRRL 13137]|uniref:FAD-binding domain-containing protein n=1 Tax=Aspergillus nomiae NRRL (strain ATCC 15546 / NRRL 13137 / CBS 260.88 / M93) TaxID=1509407 RepID=A0A0L1IV02_ASPN3|nr:uncharacterized protein ANOM_007572 [Aspergillus nomiae NRRL 13137]KNG83319.1 hypothetical protein ANOM_007572 [Aspergillus nomiae NRRL 13137]